MSGSNKIVCVKLLKTNCSSTYKKNLANNQERKTNWKNKREKFTGHSDRAQRYQRWKPWRTTIFSLNKRLTTDTTFYLKMGCLFPVKRPWERGCGNTALLADTVSYWPSQQSLSRRVFSINTSRQHAQLPVFNIICLPSTDLSRSEFPAVSRKDTVFFKTKGTNKIL